MEDLQAGGSASLVTNLHPLFTPEEIKSAVERLASEICKDYQNKNPLLVGTLKGSFVFMADLIRNLDIPLEVDFVTLSSYDERTESSGKVNIIHDLQTDIEGREVLVIEDIVDTGLTLSFLLYYLQQKKPASLKTCALLDKAARRQVPVSVNYPGLNVPDVFIVGYGLDCNESFRHLPGLYYLKDNN